MTSDLFSKVADTIFAKGAFKFGKFKLKLHETNPDAPLSPFYINIRDKNNPKPGNLDEADYDLIALSLLKVIRESDIVFDAIAGIPNAGDPIIAALERIMERDPDWNPGSFRIIKLTKVEEGGKRKIVPLPGFEYKKGERILLIDDLITKADTKLEAIRAIEEFGSVIVAIIVLVDRQQGGREQLEKAGYKLFSAFTITELFDYYYGEGKIELEEYKDCLTYIANN